MGEQQAYLKIPVRFRASLFRLLDKAGAKFPGGAVRLRSDTLLAKVRFKSVAWALPAMAK